MLHLRLLFLQPDLYDKHSCSLLFIGELYELQHFIWSLDCIEWGKCRCKAPRVFIFGSTMFSFIKSERMSHSSISPYGNLEMYIMGYVFIERLVGWKQWPVLWGTYKCFTHFGRPRFYSGFCQGLTMRMRIPSKSKVPNFSGCVVCGMTLKKCLPVPRGALAKSKIGETLAWRHRHDRFFQLPVYIQNVVI